MICQLVNYKSCSAIQWCSVEPCEAVQHGNKNELERMFTVIALKMCLIPKTLNYISFFFAKIINTFLGHFND